MFVPMLFLSAVLVLHVGQRDVSATPVPIVFYSWGQGTNAVSKIEGGTTVDTWSSDSTVNGAATGVASDGTYVYWANGRKVFREAITASAGATATTILDITGWMADQFGNPTIRALAVDASHIYIVASRGYDGSHVFRASSTTFLRDSDWTWSLAQGREAWGVTTDSSANGSVFVSWGNVIARVSKAATSGAPTTVLQTWTQYNMPAGSSSTPLPLANDGTYVYFPNGFGGVNRRDMSLGAISGADIGTNVTVMTPLPSSGAAHGIGFNVDSGELYVASNAAGAGNTYTIYSAVPDEANPSSPTSFATFSTTTWSVNSLVVMAPPAVTPVISTQPESASKFVGDSVNLSVAATRSDSGVLSYQWRKNGVAIAGATNATFTIGSLGLSDAGTYSVIVTNTVGASTASLTSSDATLTVSAAPTTTVAVASNTAAPTLVTSANQAALTATPGGATALINGVAVTPQIVTASNSAAAQTDPAERTPEQVRELQQAATTIETRLDTIAGGDSGVSVVRTDTGAVMTGIFSGTRVPVEDVVVVNAADTATLFAARDVRGNIVEVKPGAVLEVASNGDVAVQAFGLTPGESVELVVMSTPTLLGNYTVDAKGTIKTTAKLPTTIGTGNHSLVVASPSVKASLGLKLVKSSATLPVTGSTTTDLSNWAVAVLLSGVYVMLASRSRRRVF
jgi:hypothetical protein